MPELKYFHARNKYNQSAFHSVAGQNSLYKQDRSSYTRSYARIFNAQTEDLLSQASFDRLTGDWIKAIRFSSSLDDIVNDANYLAIISHGQAAIPYIIRDLRESPKAWFVALRKITGHNPIPKDQAGSFRVMVKCWLDWADRNGY